MPARRRGKKIDYTRWVSTGAIGVLALSAGTDGQLALTTGVRPETLMRTRGQLVVTLDGVQAPTSLLDVAVGLIKVPEGQGTTVVSSPITDGNAPWLYYERFTIGYEEMVADVIDIPSLTIFRAEIDSKAMRIIRPDEEVQFVVEQATISGSAAINVAASFRFLLGL